MQRNSDIEVETSKSLARLPAVSIRKWLGRFGRGGIRESSDCLHLEKTRCTVKGSLECSGGSNAVQLGARQGIEHRISRVSVRSQTANAHVDMSGHVRSSCRQVLYGSTCLQIFYPLFYYSAVLVTIRNQNRFITVRAIFQYIRASSRGRVSTFVVTRVNVKLRPQFFKVGLLDEDYCSPRWEMIYMIGTWAPSQKPRQQC